MITPSNQKPVEKNNVLTAEKLESEKTPTANGNQKTEKPNAISILDPKPEKTTVPTPEKQNPGKEPVTPTGTEKENPDQRKPETQTEEVTRRHQVGEPEITKNPVVAEETPKAPNQA